MEQIQLLKKIADDVDNIKHELMEIKEELHDMKEHEVRPEYLKKLKKIESSKFLSREQLEEELAE